MDRWILWTMQEAKHKFISRHISTAKYISISLTVQTHDTSPPSPEAMNPNEEARRGTIAHVGQPPSCVVPLPIGTT